MKISNHAAILGRKLEFLSHPSEAGWGYTKTQYDTFGILYPKDYDETKTYPLCVVFHSAGHSIYNIFNCLFTDGDHDVYKVPDDMFGLFPDCFSQGWGTQDWWWGGRNAHEPEKTERSGVSPKPVENRILATIEHTLDTFPIDRNRIYGVGNSMGGSGALGIGLCRGDIFACLKVNVPAGVFHAIDRCGFEDAPEGFSIPEPPIVVDYSAQNDTWSDGHEHLYRAARENGIALMGFWGNFGHENNHATINKYNDLVQAFDIFTVKKNEAYPAFANATTDDKNPWENDRSSEDAGQVNAFFRWRVLKDAEDSFEIELRLFRQDEWQSRLTFPTESTADVTLRRLQSFKPVYGDVIAYSFGDVTGDVSFDGKLKIPSLTVTTEPKILKIIRK